jgi:hypothetical protein
MPLLPSSFLGPNLLFQGQKRKAEFQEVKMEGQEDIKPPVAKKLATEELKERIATRAAIPLQAPPLNPKMVKF